MGPTTTATLTSTSARRPPEVEPVAHRDRVQIVLTRVAVGSLLAVGALERFWAMSGATSDVDSDEAVIGLMARHLLDGEFPTWYWGQQYGGVPSIVLMAPFEWLLGPSKLALRAVVLVLSAVIPVLVWRIATRTLPASSAAFAGALAWAAPAPFVWFGVRALGFYAETVTAGLAIVLLVQRIDEGRRFVAAHWLAVGALAGVGWWMGPSIAYFVIPAGIWLLTRRRWAAVAWSPVALVSFGVMAWPWLRVNVGDGYPSLHALDSIASGSYLDHLRYFVTTGVPYSFGLRLPFSGTWWPGLPLGALVAVVVSAALVAGGWRALRGQEIAAWGAVAFPFVYAVSPVAMTLAQGRYLYYLGPWLALLVANLARKPRAMFAAAVVTLVLIGVGWRNLNTALEQPRLDADAVLDELERSGHRYAYTDYWLAYVMDYLGDERLVATPFVFTRNDEYRAEVDAAPSAVYLFDPRVPGYTIFQDSLRTLGIPFEVVEVSTIAIVVPDQKITPLELGIDPALLGT